MCENLLVLRFLKLEQGVIYTLEKFLETQDAKREESVSQLIQACASISPFPFDLTSTGSLCSVIQSTSRRHSGSFDIEP